MPGYCVLADFVSFAFTRTRTLIHSVARPLPTKTAALGFGGAPLVAHILYIEEELGE